MEKFLSLVPPRKAQMLQQVVTYGRVDTKGNFKPFALKVVAVAYKRFQIYCFDLEPFRILQNCSLRIGR